ncbi:MAG: hypothetical protein ACXIUW_11665 [Roseinatronobacter sp.]
MDRTDCNREKTLLHRPVIETGCMQEPVLIHGNDARDDDIRETSGWWIVPCVFLGALSWVGIFYIIFS